MGHDQGLAAPYRLRTTGRPAMARGVGSDRAPRWCGQVHMLADNVQPTRPSPSACRGPPTITILCPLCLAVDAAHGTGDRQEREGEKQMDNQKHLGDVTRLAACDAPDVIGCHRSKPHNIRKHNRAGR
jgi:hypothetical protein